MITIAPRSLSYRLVYRAVTALERQREVCLRDLDTIDQLRDAALADPVRYVANLLSRGDDTNKQADNNAHASRDATDDTLSTLKAPRLQKVVRLSRCISFPTMDVVMASSIASIERQSGRPASVAQTNTPEATPAATTPTDNNPPQTAEPPTDKRTLVHSMLRKYAQHARTTSTAAFLANAGTTTHGGALARTSEPSDEDGADVDANTGNDIGASAGKTRMLHRRTSVLSMSSSDRRLVQTNSGNLLPQTPPRTPAHDGTTTLPFDILREEKIHYRRTRVSGAYYRTRGMRAIVEMPESDSSGDGLAAEEEMPRMWSCDTLPLGDGDDLLDGLPASAVDSEEFRELQLLLKQREHLKRRQLEILEDGQAAKRQQRDVGNVHTNGALSAISDVVHHGYRCDDCGCEPIIGTRFKCRHCPASAEVDLCSQCHTKGTFASATHHPRSHRFVEMREAEEAPYWMEGGSVGEGGHGMFSYLDPSDTRAPGYARRV